MVLDELGTFLSDKLPRLMGRFLQLMVTCIGTPSVTLLIKGPCMTLALVILTTLTLYISGFTRHDATNKDSKNY